MWFPSPFTLSLNAAGETTCVVASWDVTEFSVFPFFVLEAALVGNIPDLETAFHLALAFTAVGWD